MILHFRRTLRFPAREREKAVGRRADVSPTILFCPVLSTGLHLSHLFIATVVGWRVGEE